MFPPYEFYRYFMVDYFIYKQVTYKNILDNYSKVESIVMHNVFDYNKENYFKTLKSSIRITYFHSIETLFELIFALEQGIRSEVNEHQDELILQRLAKSDYRINFERINRIANNDQDELKKWDEEFIFKSMGKPISLIRYIFYYIISPDNITLDKVNWDKMDPSLNSIKKTLILLAKDFADRKEYNAYNMDLEYYP